MVSLRRLSSGLSFALTAISLLPTSVASAVAVLDGAPLP